MTDIAIALDAETGLFDFAIEGGGLATDDGLRTAILISLLTDARARDDDDLPDPNGDHRGWWGDCANADSNDRIGSRLWLLERAKLTDATVLKARDIAREALAWLVEDGIAQAVDIEVTRIAPTASRPTGALGIRISITRTTGATAARFDFVWDATARSLTTS
ncbi:phage GP46 family protein [Sphingomonas hengshuiensis]|uniref:Phage tail protein n=1 Tax=Sphingomonas hengshuiensis TaxID=1609977 RepID=A0A7U4JAC9_9SPHN|nr:phage GP46 family protein [Sphingomonas hengshuiensis]AJP73172.1 hypothetical protein TS85_17320 [Sphingomonas hengshuiensis]